jgi:hypothetical protein
VVLPCRAPLPEPIATVTLFVALVTRLSDWSRISTCTAGVSVAPAVVLAGGCTTKFRLVGAAGVTVTVGCWLIATPPIVADTVLISALVELRPPLITPFPSVTPAGCVKAVPVAGDAANTTVFPGTGLPN